MGDSGEGLIDADARIQELADEREAARRERRTPHAPIDPVKSAQTASLKLGLAELKRHSTPRAPRPQKATQSRDCGRREKRLANLA